MNRPQGTAGRPITAITNCFELKWSESKVYHYHEFKKSDPPPGAPPPRPRKFPVNPSANPNDDDGISKSKRQELIMRLQHEVRPDIFSRNPGAFDGRNNLYSVHPYQMENPQMFEVPWGPPRGQRAGRTVRITLTKVNDIDRGHIQALLRGAQDPAVPGNQAMLTLNMLNIFVQAHPRMQTGTLYNARSFFIGDSRSTKEAPFEIWHGYYQTVRPTFDRLIVNVDITVGVVIPARPLPDIFVDYIRKRDIRELNLSREHPNFRSLRLFARTLKIVIGLSRHEKNQRPKEIKDLVPDCGSHTFDKNGEDVTVRDHFQQAHGIAIPPRTLGIKTKKGDVFPISVCKTIEQLYKGKNAPNVVSEAMRLVPQRPEQRLGKIQASFQHLRYAESAFLLRAGLSVNTRPMNVNGRILSSSKVVFSGNSEENHKFPGVWDVMRKRFFNAARIDSWTVVCFAQNAPKQVLQRFVDGLRGEMQARGMNVGAPFDITVHNPQSDPRRILMEAGAKAKASLILVILPDPAEDLRNQVKAFGDVERGIPTQCVKWNNKREQDVMSNRGINQYHNNLILKINMRMGGINFRPSRDWFKTSPTMILGADVSHPGPGSALPSVSALVGSVDPWFTRYVAATRIQDPRLEMIDDLGGMFEQVLDQFEKMNKRLPAQLIFYRDGVSEGEFSQVRNVEIPRLAEVVQKKYGPEKKMWPVLTFIIVGKKHHLRFFPDGQSGRDEKGNGNLFPGFVVDGGIVHPYYSDFYLQSQAGLKGTSRPSHYTVLTETRLTPDDLQEFTFHLCHCYLRSTRSVKIPAPVYYADLVCSRAKFHFKDNGSVSGESTGSGSFDRDMWLSNFAPIHPNMRGSMYWV